MTEIYKDLNIEFANITDGTAGKAASISHAIEHVNWVSKKIEMDKKTTSASATAIKCFRGQIFWAKLGRNIGSEENKRRPVLIIQNDLGNRFGPTTLVAPISDDLSGLKYDVNVEIKIKAPDPKKEKEMVDIVYGVLLTGQIRVMSKSRLENIICDLNDSQLQEHNPHIPQLINKIDKALKKSLSLK